MRKQPNATPRSPGFGGPESERREFGRRDFLRVFGAGAASVATAASFVEEGHASTSTYQDKSKARYQPNSTDVQNFYRVNRYPAR
jgi:hypothetical protein